MIYVYAYDFKSQKRCVMRARCRHCLNSWFPSGCQGDSDYYSVFGQCHYSDDSVKRVVRGQLACSRFCPKRSIEVVSKEVDQLSLFN